METYGYLKHEKSGRYLKYFDSENSFITGVEDYHDATVFKQSENLIHDNFFQYLLKKVVFPHKGFTTMVLDFDISNDKIVFVECEIKLLVPKFKKDDEVQFKFVTHYKGRVLEDSDDKNDEVLVKWIHKDDPEILHLREIELIDK